MKDAQGRNRGLLWMFALIVAILLLVFAANAGSMLVVNAPEKADVIVVLAGETDRRPARAMELLDQGYAPRVLIDVPEIRIFGFTDTQLAEQYVRGLPEAASVRICAIEGLYTKDESHDAEKCLGQEAANRVLLVTSDYHTRRALIIFRHEIPEKHFSIAAAYDNAQYGAHWWTHRQWAKTCVNEWLRLLWWTAVDRWR
jgi:hypothetical protein